MGVDDEENGGATTTSFLALDFENSDAAENGFEDSDAADDEGAEDSDSRLVREIGRIEEDDFVDVDEDGAGAAGAADEVL